MNVSPTDAGLLDADQDVVLTRVPALLVSLKVKPLEADCFWRAGMVFDMCGFRAYGWGSTSILADVRQLSFCFGLLSAWRVG